MMPLLILAACQTNKKVEGLNPEDMDLSVAPGDNFYQYANGGWIKNNPLRPEYARFGAFDSLSETNEENLNAMFQEMASLETTPGTVEQKIADLYKMALDSTRLNAEGFEPVRKYVDEIYAIPNKTELVKKVAELHLVGEGPFFGVGVSADLMDSNMNIGYMGQGGLGMRDRDYYTEPANAALKEGYRKMLTKLFELAGYEEDNAKRADSVISFEDKLAAISWTRLQNRDVEASYNPMSSDEIIKKYQGFDFGTYFAALGLPPQDKVIVEQPSFFEGFGPLFAQTSLDDLKNYIVSGIIMGACGNISDEFYDAYFDFFSRQMTGVSEQKPRWKRAMAVPNGVLGEAVGQMYVSKYFPESSKQQVKELVENLRTALSQHIAELDWMSDATKEYAQQKLKAFTVKVGYPDKWKDYSGINIDPKKSYYENMREVSIWFVQDNMKDLGKPVDKEEWHMSPQTVNAYYNPTSNEICFPAAILQPPFFNPNADDATNYGAIGVVIGHEMTHGFDDQGRLFDKDGNMTNWWTEEDDAKFREKANKLAAQFDEVEVLPGVHANGQLTMGENIADHGGLSIAFTALQNAWNGVHPKPIDGFTAEQRFYLGYARVWAQNITDEEIARRTKEDVHSLGNNRVNVSVRNFQSFFDAFGIKEGDPMYRPESERVHIW